MAKVEVQQLPQAKSPSADSLLARVCMYYPYTLTQARRLPWKDVKVLLKEIEIEKAKKSYDMLQIVTAPQTKRGEGVKVLLKHYKKVING